MSAVKESDSRYTAEYRHIAALLPGQDLPWLSKLRVEALQQFSAQGFPSPREEEWKYTNIAAIEKKLFTPDFSSDKTDVAVDSLKKWQLENCWTVVLIDGVFSAGLSSLQDLPDEVIITSLAEALVKYPERVENYFGKAVKSEDHGFLYFNTAWFTDGLFVYLPAKTVLAKPVQLLHVVTKPESLATTRHIIALDEMAEGKIIETFVGLDELSYLVDAVTEVFVSRNAGLSLYKLQNESEKAFHFGGAYVKQDREGRLNHFSYSFGGILSRNEIHVDLEQAAECNLFGLYIGVKRQHVDNHTRINHLGPHGRSRELYKGVLDQRARGVFQGRVIVYEDAQQTDSEMNNHNLLLSEHAEVDTKPQLEIYADDVKCAHGVTVGQLDEKSIFYLQARGVDLESARNMLTFAFANEMVDKLDLECFKTLVLEQLLEHFPQTGIVREWL
jgi:Fe-S cluster assembly protein SufD